MKNCNQMRCYINGQINNCDNECEININSLTPDEATRLVEYVNISRIDKEAIDYNGQTK